MPLPSLSGSGLVFTLWVSGKLSRQWALFETFCGTDKEEILSMMVKITETLCSTKLFFVIFSMQRQRCWSTWRRPGSWRATWAWIWWWRQPPRRWPTVRQNNQYLRTMAPVLVHLLKSESENLFLTLLLCFIHVLLIFFSSIIFIYSWYSILQRSPWVAPDQSQSHLEKQASSQPPSPIKLKKDLITIIKNISF